MAKKSRWQVIYRYICRTSKNPESLARGVGLGLFIGFLPAIGFQVILAFLVAGFFNANRLVTVLGTLVSNPFTAVPLGAVSIWLGDFILPGSTITKFSLENLSWNSLLSTSGQLLIPYLVGCLLLSVAFSSIGYGAMKFYFARCPRG